MGNKGKYRLYWNDFKHSIYKGSLNLMTFNIINEIKEKRSYGHDSTLYPTKIVWRHLLHFLPNDSSVWTSTSVRNNLSPFVTQPPSAETLRDHSSVPARRPTWATPSRAGVNLEANVSTTETVLRPRLVEKAVALILVSHFADLMPSVPSLTIR